MSSISPPNRIHQMSYRPLARIPERRSSRLFRSTQSSSSPDNLSLSPPPTKQPAPILHAFRRQLAVTARGKSASPIKQRSTIQEPVRTTFVPTVPPNDILQIPKLSHSRVHFDVHLLAPLFVGGATLEGEIHIKLDANYSEAKKRVLPKLTVNRISATIIGVEHCKGRYQIFNALTTHVLHVGDLAAFEDQVKPFSIDLPIRMGPPPYKSRRASIVYLLSVLIEFRTGDETHFVRQTREIDVLSVHDPEQALVNLSSPIVVKDTLHISENSVQLTAALHRKTWIGGYLIFVDLNVENRTTKGIKRIDLQLEKLIMFYEKSSSTPESSQTPQNPRIPEEMHKVTLVRRRVLAAPESILPNTASFRTAHLLIPPDNVSITTARCFSVTHTLSVKLTFSYTKTLKVSLPIVLIHPNSIDIPPNALAQVAASLERARSKSRTSRLTTPVHQPYRSGSAFTAARRASLQQLHDRAYWAGKRVVGHATHVPTVHTDTERPQGHHTSTSQNARAHERDIASLELDDLARALERSPRRYAPIRITATPGRPSIDTLANRPIGLSRRSYDRTDDMNRGRPKVEEGLPFQSPQEVGPDDTQKIRIKRRRSVAAMLAGESGDLDLSHFDGTRDRDQRERNWLRRGSKSLDLGSNKGHILAEGGFDGGISERVWPGGGNDDQNEETVSRSGENSARRARDESKVKRQKLKYRFPGSTEMDALGSDESISTKRPDDTPSPLPSPPPTPRRSTKHSRSVSFEDERDFDSSSSSSSENVGTVNKTPKRKGRPGFSGMSPAMGRRPGLDAILAKVEDDDGSDEENLGMVLAERFGMRRREMEDGRNAAVKGRWRGRFLFG